MEHLSPIQVDEVLLARFLAGEASPHEAMAVDDWLRLPENRLQFEEWQKAWNAGTEQQLPPDSRQEWNRFRKNLQRKKVYRLWIPAAAVLTGLLVFAGLYFTQQPAAKQLSLVPGEQPATLTLADSSLVVVNKGSRLQYPDHFGKQRAVQLKGEAYFRVAPDPAHPFLIQMGELTIRVVGTVFNIKEKASPARVEVQVTEGLVKMSAGQNELAVGKGSTGIFFRQTKELKRFDSVNTNSMSYATKNFDFQDLPLSQITTILESAFGVSLKLDNPALGSCRMTAQFDHKSLTYILDIIAATLNLSYEKKNGIFYLSGEGCD